MLGFAYTIVVSMFVAFIFWYGGLGKAGIARASQVQLIQPLLTVVWAGLLLHESIGGGTVDRRARRRRLHRATATRPHRDGQSSTRALAAAGHPADVERLVELRLGEHAALDVALGEHRLADRRAPGERELRDLRRVVVAEVLVQRRDDRGRGLGVLEAAARRRR